MKINTEIAVFGGGCFWCTEAVYSRLRGVISILPGYAGGEVENPTYEEVCGGKTGHAEVAKIAFDPEEISYRDLLTVFFATHDPTSLNRQGNDIGTQYRSIIFFTSERQKLEAEAFIQNLNHSDPKEKSIVTEVKALEIFYEAEDYHREYYKKNSWQPYCQVVINPKLEKVKERFRELLRNE